MVYRILRAVAAVSLRWHYSRIDTEGIERIPVSGPVLLAVNHPNALVDALVVALVCPRRITFTGKATLFANPLVGRLLRIAGAVPLVRARDVAELGTPADATRNAAAFAQLHDALAKGAAVLIFPEGITGDHASLAPLRTGTARIALQVVDAGVRELQIVPVGLTFERKDAPRSRVFVQVGDPIAAAQWPRTVAEQDTRLLTAELDRRLRAVTLNFESPDAAARDLTLARQLARLFRGAQSAPVVWEPHVPLADQVAITRRVEEARAALGGAPPEIRARADALLDRLSRFHRTLVDRRIAPEDLEIDLAVPAGARFVAREGALALVAGPLAFWGWINHWIPFRIARTVARRSVSSQADPAMRTILIGIALVLVFYAIQGGAVWTLFGARWAVAYWVSLPITADLNFHLRARLVRVVRRARAYLRFRRDPGLRASLTTELQAIRAEALDVEQALTRPSGANAALPSPGSHQSLPVMPS